MEDDWLLQCNKKSGLLHSAVRLFISLHCYYISKSMLTVEQDMRGVLPSCGEGVVETIPVVGVAIRFYFDWKMIGNLDRCCFDLWLANRVESKRYRLAFLLRNI